MPLYLIHPRMPAQEVLAHDRANHTLSGMRANGELVFDPNFHIDIVKRCGYSLTAEPPEEFDHAKQPRLQT